MFITARRLLYKCTFFLLSIKGQGSEEQKAKWLPLAESFQIIGTYAQTEIGHGEYEGLWTNSPCQHLIKCLENSMENMHTDVRVEKVKYLTSCNLMNYLVYKFYFQELLCVAWRQQQHMIRPHRSLLFTRRLIQRVNGGLEIVCSKLYYIWMHFKDLVRKDT